MPYTGFITSGCAVNRARPLKIAQGHDKSHDKRIPPLLYPPESSWLPTKAGTQSLPRRGEAQVQSPAPRVSRSDPFQYQHIEVLTSKNGSRSMIDGRPGRCGSQSQANATPNTALEATSPVHYAEALESAPSGLIITVAGGLIGKARYWNDSRPT
jgi:hypothetical protein